MLSQNTEAPSQPPVTIKPGVMVQDYEPNTLEAEAKVILGYIVSSRPGKYFSIQLGTPTERKALQIITAKGKKLSWNSHIQTYESNIAKAYNFDFNS